MASRPATTSLRVDIDGDSAVIRIPATHFATPDDGSADQRLLRLAHELERAHLTLDFGAVDFLGSLGLTALLAVHKHLRARGGRLTVINVRPHVHEVFAVTRLTTILNVRQEKAA
jgi:stage II sporulation protein AA (anti-sigma F factor antagonist)